MEGLERQIQGTGGPDCFLQIQILLPTGGNGLKTRLGQRFQNLGHGQGIMLLQGKTEFHRENPP